MLRRVLLVALALCGLAHAAGPPDLQLTATPAWKGWTRPGRATELDIRLSSNTATPAVLELTAGQRSVRTELALQPGRVERVHLPLDAAEHVRLGVGAPSVPHQWREIGLSVSESPLLGVSLASGETLQLDGFHTLALSADDLPHSTAAYAGIDALVLDATTLAALVPAQRAALLGHTALCGRIVVIGDDERMGQLLQSSQACGGRALMTATSLTQARQRLQSSLALSQPAPLTLGSLGEIARPGAQVWTRVAGGLALYFALAVLAALYLRSLPLLVLAPALAAGLGLALLHVAQAPAQLVVWSEGESGERVARYQAWQLFAGSAAQRLRVTLPGPLASSSRPCDMPQALHLEIDSRSSQATAAAFDTQLFGQVALCYAGHFPMTRSMAAVPRADGGYEVRNAGTQAWPAGLLLVAGKVHDLPPLGPGDHATLHATTGRAAHGAVERLAVTRAPAQGPAALWALELAGVADASVAARGWLLVAAAAP